MAYIWHLSSVQFDTQTIMSGLIMQGKLSHKNTSLGILKNASQIVTGYFKKPFASKSIILIIKS